MRGAIIAEIGDNDASNGAAIAAIGAIAGRRQSRIAAAQDELANYHKARVVCLNAKGYSISD